MCAVLASTANFHFVSTQLLRHDGLLGTDQNETVKKKNREKDKEKKKKMVSRPWQNLILSSPLANRGIVVIF